MQGILRPVTALLLATAIVMAGHGTLVLLLPQLLISSPVETHMA
jgi:hypothetical protein